MRAQAAEGERDEREEEERGADQRRARAAQPDEHRDEDGADGEAGVHQRLEQREHLAQHLRRRGALQQDAPGDVEDRAAQAGDGDEHERADDRREDAEHAERERRRDDAGDRAPAPAGGAPRASP